MFDSRKYILQAIFIVTGFIFLSRLFVLQVLSKEYSKAADNNIIMEIIEYPYRGLIYDRNKEFLVVNEPDYDLYVIPKNVYIPDTLALCQLLNITIEEFDEKMRKAKKYSYVKPSIFSKQIGRLDYAKIQDYLVDYEGFEIRARTIRSYPDSIVANALGYIAEISPNQLENDTANYYQQGDYIGKSGLESYYEFYLRGKRGKSYKKRNVRGVEQGAFMDGDYDINAIPGLSLTTTIDITLQRYAEKLMSGKAGSVIAIEPSSGEILSIVSAPSYEPSMLAGRNYSKNFEKISQDTLKPLFNRPIMASYRPGSIFKIMQSLVAMQMGVITPKTRMECNTALIGCHNGASHPFGTSEDLVGAITNSCNPYFYRVMQRMVEQKIIDNQYDDSHYGLEQWHENVIKFGFGSPLGVDLPGEKGGLVPDPAYYDRAYDNRPWKYSNIYSLAIGEGENLVVPMQMANFVATVANRGFYFTPHLVKEIGDTGAPLPEFTVKNETGIDQSYFEIVVEAMAEVVKSGTGQYRAKLPNIEVCGKTGTVQNDPNPDHSVFIAFAPRENPQIAISVYVEDAGQGARAAAAIAGLMIDKYLNQENAQLRLEPYVLKGHFIY